MTADEVILRRHKPQNPHPHRGQSAYMALLSSLATDLDLMLNDLRSSSSPTTHRFIHHQGTSSSSSGIRSNQSSVSIVSSSHHQHYHQPHQDLLGTTSSTSTQTVGQQQHLPIPRLQQEYHHHNFHHQRQQQQQQQQQQHHFFQFRPLFSRGLLTTATTTTTSSPSSASTSITTVTASSSSTSTTRQTTTTLLGHTTSTSERNFLWSETTTPPTHQQLKSRRLPFCGVDTGGGGDNNGVINGGGGGILGGGSNNNSGTNDINNLSGNNGHNNFNSIDADGTCGGDGHFEDDLQALLPNCRQLSKDELSQSRASLVSSSDGGVLAEGETSSETSEGSASPPCDLGLVERLLRTHPVWFLPGIQRAGAVHLLQGKEEGNFIVRGSSQPNTMAVSVRLPPDTGPYIEHYLIQSNDGILSLESSRFKFDSIPALIAHYAQCCDELPVQLVLPRALREAKNRQQLSSLALLGQEFWRYPMANPKSTATTIIGGNVESKSPNSLTETSGVGTTIFSSTNSQLQQHQQQQQQPVTHHSSINQAKIFSPTNPLGNVLSQAGTPSDTTSSLSSFTTSTGQNHQLMSPESVDSVVLTMSPVEMISNRAPVIGAKNVPNNLTTFKSTTQIPPRPVPSEKPLNIDQVVRTQRPTPPNTLNLGPLRTPPAPPVRWSKPLTPISPVAPPVPNSDSGHIPTNNFTVTTTVTFSVDNKNPQQFVEVTSPTTGTNSSAISANSTTTTFQTFAKRPSPEGECKAAVDTLSSQGSSNRWNSQSSKDSNHSQRRMISPNSSEALSSNAKPRKNKSKKESKHYQESDILESPQVYCRSALGDKISDYEDIWSQETTMNNPADRGCQLSTFRPEGVQGKRPDLLPETPTITSLNCNILSPTNSVSSSNPSPPINPKLNESIQTTNNNNDKQFINNNTRPLDILSPSDLNKNFAQSVIADNNAFSNVAHQPRNRHGLVLPLNTNEEASKSESDTTPTTQTPVTSRSKQGSPFYAEPADALRAGGLSTSILRRSQRNILLPANHRHSEPPKPGIARAPICPVLAPAELEKIAGSLDELKKKQQQQQQQQHPQQQQKKIKGRLDQWPVDSSWEFMSKNENGDDDYGDYDSEEQWTGIRTKVIPSSCQPKEPKEKPITIHQIIAKRLPDLNLPELVRCSTPQQSVPLQIDIGADRENSSNSNEVGCHRMSSYDNVERNAAHLSYTTSFLNGIIDSAQSDDGTVFSEPWDSSQWDSFLPQDDTSDTIHISKCRAIISNSEDDTIMEETTLKDNNQGTLKANKSSDHQSHQPQKVATILRTRSCRDREILCHPRNKTQTGGPGESVRSYTLQLANDHTSTFSRNIENFISCTKESREAAPQVVMRNMRQFMNGMKNYLVKHGEGDFHQEVQKARSRLKADEFLNLDAILEGVMHQLVVLPLREHLYGMFVDYYTRSGDIQLLVENVKYACARNAIDFGIRPTVSPPTSMQLNQISALLVRLQEAELPLDKLDLFLCVIAAVFEATGCPRGQQLGADDFLPILVFVVAKCGFVGAEIEAEFMWGLLQPALLSGEAGYYLTALCSAVHVLKSFMASDTDGTGSLDWRSSSLPACSSVLRVIIPDECNGSLQTRTLPVRPHTTTREVCRIIAHKARITNPQDYGLFKLVDGEETILTDSECPQDARFSARGKHCILAYKRIDAKIAWPTATIQPSFA